LSDSGIPGCTNCYDGLTLRAKIKLSTASIPPLGWTLQLCREEDCSESTGPVTIVDFPQPHVQTGSPAPPWSDVYFDVGPSPLCDVHGVCITAGIRPKPGAPFQNGVSYGFHLLSNDTGEVLYDQRAPIQFTHHQCGSARPCDEANVLLPEATLAVSQPDAGGQRP
jgi:hypothetical protein